MKLGVVSADGSKFAANASKHRSVRYGRAGELIEQLRLEIAALMERAGTAVKEARADWLREMATKLDSEEGRALYRQRQQTVEPVLSARSLIDGAVFGLFDGRCGALG